MIYDESATPATGRSTARPPTCELDILRGVVTGGTGTGRRGARLARRRARPAPPTTAPTRGSCGMTPVLAAVVWHGNAEATIPGAGFGGQIPAHDLEDGSWTAQLAGTARRAVPGPGAGLVQRARGSSSPRPAGRRRSLASCPSETVPTLTPPTVVVRRAGHDPDAPRRRRPRRTAPPTTAHGPTGRPRPRRGRARRRARARSVADVDDSSPLLTLQEHDLALDRLRHRRATLPSARQWPRRSRGHRDRRRGCRCSREPLARDAAPATRSASRTRPRRSAEQAEAADGEAVLGRGLVAAELQALQADIEQLKRHQRTVEDRGSRSWRSASRSTRSSPRSTREPRQRSTPSSPTQRAALAAAEGESTARSRSSRRLRDDRRRGASNRRLLAVYERCRAKRESGIGAARLVGHTCQGCHLTIPATEVDALARRRPAPSRTATTAARSWSRDASDREVRRRRGRSSTAAARGNPGPAAIGAVVLDPSTDAAHAPRRRVSEHIGARHQQRRRVPRAHRRTRGRAARSAPGCVVVRGDSMLVHPAARGRVAA